MYLLLGISILLAALLSFNSLASLVASLLWRLFGRRAGNWPASTQASVLFLLRILPVAVGLACLIFLIIPAYIEHEPRSTTEELSFKLGLIAFASAAGIALAIVRGIAAWRATAQLTADWLSQAKSITVPGVSIPCYRIDHQFPVIAIIGILRPKLFIASQIFERLQPDEISGALHHEVGHLVAQDNLKRGLLRICRDVLLIIPCGRMLDRHWAEASESAADEHAAERGGRVALDLASALVKIARMIPSGARPAMPAGVFLVGDEPGGIRARVSHLLQLAGTDRKHGHWAVTIPRRVQWLSLFCFVLIFVLFATQTSMLATVHSLIEHAVYILN
jgi:Zn-dependent protease with chaperone function